ncbi:hypothetical protein TNCV_3012671 [Trichonephila clavipes]|nr:hypothetical protein TNCV_3012671 [Trichonephila clavipes]
MLDENPGAIRFQSVFVCSTRIGLGRPRADFCGLPMRGDEGWGVDPPWCLKGFFRRQEERPRKKETWTMEDRDWNRKRGETMNTGGVGELEFIV